MSSNDSAIMRTTVIYDVLTYSNLDFTNRYVVSLLIWTMLLGALNVGIIARASNGWLINPTITKQVILASSLALLWIGVITAQFYVRHRSLSIIVTWSGYPMTLSIALQHIELLKLFVCISEFWTLRKCRIYQITAIVLHIGLLMPGYIWPWGLDKDPFMTSVLFTE